MERVKYFPATLTTGATSTSLTYVGKHDQLIVYVPVYTSVFGTATTTMTVQVSPTQASAVTAYYYNYANGAPSLCQAAVAAPGAYEMAYAGGAAYVKVQFSTATTNATEIILLTPSDA